METFSRPSDPTRIVLDLRGLKCPLPVLRARKALDAMADGTTLILMCSDPMSRIDLPHLVKQRGDCLEAQSEEDGVLTFIVRRRRPQS